MTPIEIVHIDFMLNDVDQMQGDTGMFQRRDRDLTELLMTAQRAVAVGSMLDNRLITTSFDKLEPQLDELMTPIEIVHIDFMRK
jgi:hypothetical protein